MVGVEMTAAFITGLFTVAAGVLSALVTRYGVLFWKPAKKLMLAGQPVTRKLISPDGEVTEYPHFDQTEYYENPRLTIRGNRAVFKATYVVREGNQAILNGKIVSKGKYRDGKAYLTYDISDSDKDQGFSGVCLLYKSDMGSLTGFYLVESSLSRGSTALGTMHLERVGLLRSV